MTVKKTDKPVVTASLSALTKEIEAPEPYRLALSGSKVITFPDVFAMEFEEAEEFLTDFQSGEKTATAILSRWLSPEDFAAFKAEKLDFRKVNVVVKAVMAYYEDQFGTEGEGDASTES